MTQLDIRMFGDPVLRQEAREVTDFDERLRRLAGDMLETMRAAEGAGLAANQVGVLKRLFVWQAGEEQHGAVVNPVVTETSEDRQEGDEGCLSFPGLFYPLERPLRITTRYHDLRGEEQVEQVEGFLARIYLHEIDHLNGILFIDHLAAHDRKEAMRIMRERDLARAEGRSIPASGLPGDGAPAGEGSARGSLLRRGGGS